MRLFNLILWIIIKKQIINYGLATCIFVQHSVWNFKATTHKILTTFGNQYNPSNLICNYSFIIGRKHEYLNHYNYRTIRKHKMFHDTSYNLHSFCVNNCHKTAWKLERCHFRCCKHKHKQLVKHEIFETTVAVIKHYNSKAMHSK